MKRFISSRIVDRIEWLVYGLIIGHVSYKLVVALIGPSTYQVLTSGNGLIVLIAAVVIAAFIAYKRGSFSGHGNEAQV